ncbi:hypothetical protein [Priestia sp. JNUCC 25]
MEDEIGFLGDKILEYRFKIANEVHESRISGITEEEKKKRRNWLLLKLNLLIFVLTL